MKLFEAFMAVTRFTGIIFWTGFKAVTSMEFVNVFYIGFFKIFILCVGFTNLLCYLFMYSAMNYGFYEVDGRLWGFL